MLPEEKARVKIDKQLRNAGWDIVSRNEYLPNSTTAVKEALMVGNTESDYLLFIEGKAIAVVEAKREENPLGDEVKKQAEDYAVSPQSWYALWLENLIPLVYMANGNKIYFKNMLVPDSEYEELSQMHSPKKMLQIVGKKSEYGALPLLVLNNSSVQSDNFCSIKYLQEKLMSDCELFRSKLIDAGIQGKLTIQLQEDGFAECFNDEEIPDKDKYFDIPDNWRWIRLGWAMEIERGGSPRPIKAYMTEEENGINWIKIGDVEKDGKYIYSTKEKIKPEGEKKSRKVYPGDFLLTNSMSFGRPYISKIEGCIHDGWLLLRNSKEIFDLDYLYWLLSSKYAYNQFVQKASGATVDNLNKDKVASAIMPLPPLAEQRRIANRIEELIQLL